MPSVIGSLSVRLTLLLCLVAGASSFDLSEGSTRSDDPDSASADEFVGRRIERLNSGWEFLNADAPNPEAAGSESGWSAVELPHTWNAFDSVDQVPGYRRGAAWYRRELSVLQHEQGRRHLLHFEAANMKAEVYVNGQLAGRHVGGYVGFDVDVTPFLAASDKVQILVRVDNGHDPDLIPSQKSDFVLYGGLTRDVWLKVLPATSIEQIHVSTPDVSREEARTVVGVDVHESERAEQGLALSIRIIGPDGAVLGVAQKEVDPGYARVTVDMPRLREPSLWSPDEPSLHTVEVDLLRGGEVLDRDSERYGYRWFTFEPQGAFYLNGERLLLRGTHRHEEHAGYGAAMPDSLHRHDMEMIKGMGANFVRLAHYPQDPEVYRAADELGLIVWDELPWCRGGVGGAAWAENTERLLREMIAQHYNHPSIILWSLGNEMYWLPDHPNGGDTAALKAALQHLHDVARSLDPGRPTTMRKFAEGAHIVEVYSPSIWSGWYGGSFRQYEDAIVQARKEHPRILHVEYGGDSHVGRHMETPVDAEQLGIAGGAWAGPDRGQPQSVALGGDWSESYIVDLFDWHLHVSESLPDFTGNAQWNFKDFATPLRPENPIPYVNQKGLVDRSGRPKDAYYVFKSYWTSDPAFCYIQSHTWTHREGRVEEPRPVRVYCNTETAALSHNGKDLGMRVRDIAQFPASNLVWDVLFEDGENTLIAHGYAGSNVVTSDTLTVHFLPGSAGPMADIELSSHPLHNGRVLIEAVAVDATGRRCLDYQDRVYFSHDGDGHFVAGLGTPTGSQVIEMANGRAAIEFVPEPGGSAVIEVRNQSFKGTFLHLGPDQRPSGDARGDGGRAATI